MGRHLVDALLQLFCGKRTRRRDDCKIRGCGLLLDGLCAPDRYACEYALIADMGRDQFAALFGALGHSANHRSDYAKHNDANECD